MLKIRFIEPQAGGDLRVSIGVDYEYYVFRLVRRA